MPETNFYFCQGHSLAKGRRIFDNKTVCEFEKKIDNMVLKRKTHTIN